MDITGVEELTAALQSMDPAVIEAAVLGLGGLIVFAMAYAIIRYLMKAIGYAAMYHKAGIAPWKAFIPVYNTYNNYNISWNGKLFFLFAALHILFNVLFSGANLALQIAAAVAGIALIMVDVKQNVKMAKLFGKGIGTGIALMFFPGITSLILGLGKAEYIAIEK